MSRSRFLRFALVSALVALALGCGPNHRHDDPDPDGGGPDSGTSTDTTRFQTFFERYVALYCDGLATCESGYADLSDSECRDALAQYLDVAGIQSDIAAGTYDFEEGRAAACLALLEDSVGCEYEWSEEYCFEDSGVLVGTVGAGGACDSDAAYLCAPGTRCSAVRFSGACGVCESITPAGLGEPCEFDSDCIQSAAGLAYCDEDPIDARDECTLWTNPTTLTVGSDCDVGNVICPVGTECDWNDTVTCVAQPGPGDECDPVGDIGCAGGGECVDDSNSSLGGTCLALAIARAAGDPCGVVGSTWVWCLESSRLACDEGIGECVSLGAGVEGDPCEEVDCAAGFACDWDSVDAVCVSALADGVPCAEHSECLSGWCFGPDGASVCGAVSSVGAACGP